MQRDRDAEYISEFWRRNCSLRHRDCLRVGWVMGTPSVTCIEMVGRVCGTHSNLGVWHEVGHSQIVIELPISLKRQRKTVRSTD
jgi:hypothetical protein